MWRKPLRLALALFVVAFAIFVAVSLVRGRSRKVADAAAVKGDPNAVLQTLGQGIYNRLTEGKNGIQITSGKQATYSDNRTTFGDGVTVRLPDRSGRQITITSHDAVVTTPPGKQLGHAEFTGGVQITTSDGVTLHRRAPRMTTISSWPGSPVRSISPADG